MSGGAQVRIEQVLMSGPPLLLCFALGQLLGFYRDTLAAVLGPAAALVATLRACRAFAARSFQEQLQAAGAQLTRYPPPPPRDLSPPLQVSGLKSIKLFYLLSFCGIFFPELFTVASFSAAGN